MNKLQNHFIGTYKAIRLALFALAFLLPFVLMFGGKMLADIPMPTHSMSAYYHLNGRPKMVSDRYDYMFYVDGRPAVKDLGKMRNCFVGGLFAIGILLFSYRGYSPAEDIALDLAGIAAWGVALNPMDWPPEDTEGFSVSPHLACASLVFFCIAYVCILRSWDTLSESEISPKMKKSFKSLYVSLGWTMLAFPLIAWVLNSLIGTKNTATFWLEAVGIWIFSAYWLAKTIELWDCQIDSMVSSGRLGHPSGKAPWLRRSSLQRQY